jgi:hypothetical protein
MERQIWLATLPKVHTRTVWDRGPGEGEPEPDSIPPTKIAILIVMNVGSFRRSKFWSLKFLFHRVAGINLTKVIPLGSV